MAVERVFTVEDARLSITIDKHDLDKELVQQSELFARVVQAVTLAVSLKDEAKELLGMVEATVRLEYRQKAVVAGDKITEGVVAERTRVDERMVSATDDWLQTKKVADDWSGLREAYSQRMNMLRELVSLYGMGYFMDSSARSARSGAGADKLYSDDKAELAKGRRRRATQ